MAKTKDEICRLAARELRISAAAQQADGPTFGIIQNKFDGILADLQAREIAAWGTDGTPNECAEALSVYLAQSCANAVPTGDEVLAYFTGLGRKPFLDLVAVTARKWRTGMQTTGDKF